MKQSKFGESQIFKILKQAESGVPVADLCREHGMSSANFYKWRQMAKECLQKMQTASVIVVIFSAHYIPCRYS